jgi:hypothetical protein
MESEKSRGLLRVSRVTDFCDRLVETKQLECLPGKACRNRAISTKGDFAATVYRAIFRGMMLNH